MEKLEQIKMMMIIGALHACAIAVFVEYLKRVHGLSKVGRRWVPLLLGLSVVVFVPLAWDFCEITLELNEWQVVSGLFVCWGFSVAGSWGAYAAWENFETDILGAIKRKIGRLGEK